MKIKLISDFVDIYDHWFCGSYETPDMIFERKLRNNMSRFDMFMLFENLNLHTPIFGYIERDLCFYRWNDKIEDVVIYLDKYSHQGSDKIKVSFREAFLYKGELCSQFILPNEIATSYRYLKIGSRSFWLKYKSDHEWLSNNGNVEIKVISELRDNFYNFDICYPIYAIDFLLNNEKLYAIDFNSSPGLKNTGIEEFISNKEIYQEIEDWFKSNHQPIQQNL